MANDSNLSRGDRSGNERSPIRMQHRNALGQKVNGTSNPNGAERGPTDNKIKNGKNY